MNALTTTIRFELDSRLNEIATIKENCNGLWAFTTTRGYNGWEGDLFKSFDKCYSELKAYEKRNVNELKYIYDENRKSPRWQTIHIIK